MERVQPTSKECRGITFYTGPVYHGTRLKQGMDSHTIDISMDYRNYSLGKSSNPEVSTLLGDNSFTLGPALYTTTDID